jgi:soluble lytic murein transglycosylase-like protein
VFDLDRKLIYSIIILESEFNDKAKNINNGRYGTTSDRGLMQINTCHNETLMSDENLYIISGGNTNRLHHIEEIIYRVDSNIWAGCYVLSDKIAYRKGNMFEGVKAYNGSGWQADNYAKSIFDIYYSIAKEL